MESIKKRNAAFRNELFRHLDGIAIAPAAYELESHGVLKHLLEVKSSRIDDLANKFKANPGYLNVALRLLASQGWLDYVVDNTSKEVVVNTNGKSETAFTLAPHYKEVVDLMKFSADFHPRKFEKEPFEVWNRIAKKFEGGYFQLSGNKDEREIQEQILKHIEGILVGPSTVQLGMGGMFHKYFMEMSFSPSEYHQDPESFEQILDFFSHLGWFVKKNRTYKFTEKGLFFAKRSSAYGVTVSYIPTFRNLDELIFGNPEILKVAEGQPEKGVDREMNVWGSGGAHVAYFEKVDDIIIDLFNKPIDEQPKGILDMGCGNGAFLIHIFDVVFHKTRRGKMLEEHPLFLVGADYNEAALKVTRENLINADVWAKVVWGDIGDPERLDSDLKENYEMSLSDLLNVRTFLDHNRMWEDVNEKIEKSSVSTGAFASKGRLLSNDEVEANLKAHLNKWKPYIRKFGLIVIELHGLDSKTTAANLGKTASTAYEATHGFSDQYILEVDSFDKVIGETGLSIDPTHRYKFPNSELATVSINYLK
ncbi:class I SAM-dependent methyltransferase [Ekhidna sp. To15]|uniref:class I SAM-dependent methyltransferase n=1 Tax=Ekhidna sp. To15 TaxID=3395267 RepID=UPI003F52747B